MFCVLTLYLYGKVTSQTSQKGRVCCRIVHVFQGRARHNQKRDLEIWKTPSCPEMSEYLAPPGPLPSGVFAPRSTAAPLRPDNYSMQAMVVPPALVPARRSSSQPIMLLCTKRFGPKSNLAGTQILPGFRMRLGSVYSAPQSRPALCYGIIKQQRVSSASDAAADKLPAADGLAFRPDEIRAGR